VTATARIRARWYAPSIRRRAELMRGESEPAGRERAQLELLNAAWVRSVERVPYFRDLRARGDLPTSFASLSEFCERVPATTRETVQRHADRLTVEGARPELVRMTGGSTSQPLQLPAWRSELSESALDMWVGRGWYGVGPDARLFLLWGHSHLLGTGWRGRVNAARRALSDRLLGYHRFSAYDLRPETLRRAGDALLDFAPRYVVGYSVALDLLARANQDRAGAFARLGLAAVVGTAEAFPGPDSVARIGEVFGAPVAMEYGAVETGVVAHTHPDGGYRVFWRTHFLDAERGADGHHVLRVTSLGPRFMPLVRYEIGDEVDLGPAAPEHAIGLARFHRVVGRCNDYVPLAGGARIHSEAFSHAVRPCAEVRAFQVCHGTRGIRIRYTADAALCGERAAEIRDRLRRIHADLADVEFVRVPELPQTVAGKTRMVVAE
jgi:phenylacetate-coenzyme A ligase PaaK-like adenylate-forming protein